MKIPAAQPHRLPAGRAHGVAVPVTAMVIGLGTPAAAWAAPMGDPLAQLSAGFDSEPQTRAAAPAASWDVSIGWSDGHQGAEAYYAPASALTGKGSGGGGGAPSSSVPPPAPVTGPPAPAIFITAASATTAAGAGTTGTTHAAGVMGPPVDSVYVPAPAPATAPVPTVSPVTPVLAPTAPAPLSGVSTVTTAPAVKVPAARPAAPAARQEAAPAPGPVEADPATAQRALERTLVLEGNLLLPFGSVDLSPFAAYQYDEDDGQPAPFLVIPPDQQIVTDRVQKMQSASVGFSARIGLPAETQLELSVPFVWQQTDVEQDFLPASNTSQSDTGVGNVSVGIAKSLWREGQYAPDLIGRVTWRAKSDSDVDDDGGSVASPFHAIEGSVSMIKRQDPLVFTASAGYEARLSDDDIDPGNAVSLGGAVLLAASPETSLLLGFETSFIGETSINGMDIPGSDRHVSQLTAGFSSIIGKSRALNVSVGIGVTEDAPDYAVSISIPMRFRF